MCELLVEKVLSSCLAPLSVGDALRRFFEAVASGVLLKSTSFFSVSERQLTVRSLNFIFF